MWKGKYQNIDNTKNGKRKGKLLPNNEEISGGKAHADRWKVIWYISTITGVFLNQKRAKITYICSLLIEKDISDRQNISNKFPFVCIFLWRSLHFLVSFPFLFSFFAFLDVLGRSKSQWSWDIILLQGNTLSCTRVWDLWWLSTVLPSQREYQNIWSSFFLNNNFSQTVISLSLGLCKWPS